jgi:hypothetical protein
MCAAHFIFAAKNHGELAVDEIILSDTHCFVNRRKNAADKFFIFFVAVAGPPIRRAAVEAERVRREVRLPGRPRERPAALGGSLASFAVAVESKPMLAVAASSWAMAGGVSAIHGDGGQVAGFVAAADASGERAIMIPRSVGHDGP